MADADVDLSLPGPGFQVFDTLEAFYRDQRRARSGEVDFGVWWTLPEQRWPNWRVSWVAATGEVYAVAQTHAMGPVVARGGFPTREAVEAALDGWTEHCGSSGGLGWLWERLAGQMLGPMQEHDFSVPGEDEMQQTGQRLMDMARQMGAARGLTAVGVFCVFLLVTDEGALVTASLGPTRSSQASDLVRKLIEATETTISQFTGDEGATVVPPTQFRGLES